MIGKRDGFWGDSEKQWALELTWRRMADCSKGGIRPLETHDHWQWTAEYVGSLAAWTTTTGDGSGWNQRRAGCGRKDSVAPDHAGQTMQASVDEHSQLEVDAFWRPQAVKVSQHRCDVLVSRRSMNQSGSGIEHWPKSMELGRGKPSKCCVAIVETWHDQRVKHRVGHWTSDAAELS